MFNKVSSDLSLRYLAFFLVGTAITQLGLNGFYIFANTLCNCRKKLDFLFLSTSTFLQFLLSIPPHTGRKLIVIQGIQNLIAV